MTSDIPEGWEEKQITQFSEISSGSTPSTSDSRYWNGEIVWITPDDLSGNSSIYMSTSSRKISKSGLKNSSTTIIPKNSIVMSSRAPIGYVAIMKVDYTTNQGCKSFKLKNVCSEFIYYSLLFNMEKIKNLGEGTTFSEISKTSLEKVSLIIPKKIKEQQKIASILQTNDNTIDKTKEVIEKHKMMKHGLSEDLLKDEAGKITLSAGELLKKGILEEIQDGNHGEQHPKYTDFVTNGVPFIMANDIIDGKINFDLCHKISEKMYNSLRVGFAKPGDVLLTHKGTIGKTCIVPKTFDKIILTPQVTYYRIKKKNQLDEGYLYHFFNSDFFQRQIQSMSAQSTRNYVGILAQRKLKIRFNEDIEKQKRIAQKLNVLDFKIETEQAYLEKLIKLKTGLMHDLLTGKVRVVA